MNPPVPPSQCGPCPFDCPKSRTPIDSRYVKVGAIGTDQSGKKRQFKSCDDFADKKFMKSVLGDFESNVCPKEGYHLNIPEDAAHAQCRTKQLNGGKGLSLVNGCITGVIKNTLNEKLRCCVGEMDNEAQECEMGLCLNSKRCVRNSKEDGVLWPLCYNEAYKGKYNPYCKKFIQKTSDPLLQWTVVNYVTQPLQEEINTQGKKFDFAKSKFKKVTREVCSDASPGFCDDVLTKACKGLTRAQVANDPDLLALCGCHMDDKVYDKYSKVLVGEGGKTQWQCDPLCNDVTAIQRAFPGKEGCIPPNECTQTICVIDITAENVKKMINNGVFFSQKCAGGTGQGSTCYIGFTDKDADYLKQTNVKWNQECTNCFKFNPGDPQDKTTTKLNCSGSVLGGSKGNGNGDGDGGNGDGNGGNGDGNGTKNGDGGDDGNGTTKTKINVKQLAIDIGIGIGAIVGVLFILWIVWYIILRPR